VDVVEAVIRNVDFVRNVSVVPLDFASMAGDACATQRQDILPHVGPEVFCRSCWQDALPLGCNGLWMTAKIFCRSDAGIHGLMQPVEMSQ
jgi:hypothetical protein